MIPAGAALVKNSKNVTENKNIEYNIFMTEIRIIKTSISKTELKKIAEERFGDLVKAVVDVKQEIMAVGGELHVDMQSLLVEQENSTGIDTWGINIYPNATGDNFIEFDSMVNLKPALGNRTRGVEDKNLRKKITSIVNDLVRNDE
jgi:hypothetical protein